ncbi:MAG: zinc-binding alcohol dehydrogenase family protein [Cytophagales bacterium]|nr:zinc-binding alcohol dehydrogenase family protein [Cytophagales bacterium]
MRILTCLKPGEFAYSNGPIPEIKKGFALIKVQRIGICGTDLHAFEGTQPFFNYPRVLGHELAGEIVEIETHADYQIGDQVSIIPYFSCGTCFACSQGKTNCCSTLNVFGVHSDGGMAEFILIPIQALFKSASLDLDALALLEPLSIGAHGIKRAQIKPHEFVLIVGAGPIGLGAAAMASLAGAQVIMQDVNQNRLDFAIDKLGIPYSINPNQEDALLALKEITHGNMPRVVIDATGNKKAMEHSFQYISHGGTYVLIGLQMSEISFSHPEFHKREATLMSSRNATREDFQWVANSIEQKLIDPSLFISHRIAFEDLASQFLDLINPSMGVIKAMVSFE